MMVLKSAGHSDIITRINQLLRLKQLVGCTSLELFNQDYRQVAIPEGSVVYCDLPYQNTAEYGAPFNHQEFFDWCKGQSRPVYVSSYEIFELGFECILEQKKISNLAPGKTSKNVERLYKTQQSLTS
jgi:DNA adenine methylase